MRKVSATMSFSPRFTFSAQATRIYPEPPEKPPRPPFIDRNLKAAKFVLKGVRWLGQIGSVIGGVKTIRELFIQKRQPAEAGQV